MSNYPANWDIIRKSIYQRDNYTCQRCGDKNAELHCHHKQPISKGGGHDPDNLITVCKSCHETIHGHQIGPGDGTESPGLFAYSAFISLMIVLSIGFPPAMIVTIPLLIVALYGLFGEMFE